MSTTPRIRQDLQATVAEEAGIAYFDVADPRTGGSMRMYGFEWKLAQRMDGHASFAELAAWAASEFGWPASADDVASYAEKLADLGFFDGAPVEVAAAGPVAAAATATPPPPPAPHVAAPAVEPAAPSAGGDGKSDEPPHVEAPHDGETTPPFGVATQVFADAADDKENATPLPPPAPTIDAAPSGDTIAEPAPLPRTPDDSDPPPPRAAVRANDRHDDERAATQRRGTPPAKKSSSMGLTATLVVVLLGAGGYAAWSRILAPMMNPVSVLAVTAPAATTAVKYFGREGKVARSEPVVVNFAEGGMLLEILPAGTDLKPGMVVAKLDGIQAVEKDLTDVRERLKYYEGKHDAAKIEEKKRLIAADEEKEKKFELIAAVSGTISEATAQPGSTVKAGDAAVKIVDNRLVAEFQLAPGEAAAFKVDAPVKLQSPTGAATGKVLAVGDADVKVEVTDGAKVGDALRMVKEEVPNVVRIPAVAVHSGQVYVVEGGVAHGRAVKVAEQDGADALVSDGVKAGDVVITNFPVELQEGKKVAVTSN